MLNKTYIGISQALNTTLGSGYTVYIDNVEQDLKTPCFYIKILNPSNEQKLGNRYERIQPFDVHYFPQSENYTVECMDMVEKLYDALEYITVGVDLVRGTKMDVNLQDGVLHFFVNYDMFVLKIVSGETMAELQSDVDLKEGE
ncbi:MAG: DUF6838 family protein [Lachnotalea sp.]